MIFSLLVLGFVIMSVRGALFLMHDADRQSRAYARSLETESIRTTVHIQSIGSGDWTALDEHQLIRLLRESA